MSLTRTLMRILGASPQLGVLRRVDEETVPLTLAESLFLWLWGRERLEMPETPSEERPRGACLGVSEGPRSLRGCAERGWLGGTGLQRVGPGTL